MVSRRPAGRWIAWLAVLCLALLAASADGYRGPHGKAALDKRRRPYRRRAALSRVSASSGTLASVAPATASVLAHLPLPPGSTAADVAEAVAVRIPPGGRTEERRYDAPAVVCVTAGCVSASAAAGGPAALARPLCAEERGAAPRCAPVGGPGTAPFSLANAGWGTATALEFVLRLRRTEI